MAVKQIDRHAHGEPDDEAGPGFPGQARHQAKAGENAQGRQGGEPGTRKGRASSGLGTAQCVTARQTSAKAASVPMLTISPSRPIGKYPAVSATTRPSSQLADPGRAKTREMVEIQGTNPSVAIAKKMRDCPYSRTRITVVSPASAANLTTSASEGSADGVDGDGDGVGRSSRR